MTKYLTLLILLVFIAPIVNAQPWFYKVDSIEVKESAIKLKYPWAGGLNSCEFSEIDLDLDGIKDLFVFDKTGNKITTFLNKGTPGTLDYVLAPEYRDKFPFMREWALLADYNCDGKADIFTFSDFCNCGIAVYKNVSTLANGLQFSIVTEKLLSNYVPNSFNLYVSPVDIPAIADIDNDGDLDILTFQISGSYVEYHKNLSMETYGNCDSLKFQIKNRCWGYFYENTLSNSVTLHQSCSGNVSNPQKKEEPNIMHSGSTLLALDLDGDADKDLVLGDVSFNNFTMLTNGGSVNTASMTAQDGAFPSNSLAVDLTLFPAGFYLDVNNDGKKDLLVSPNAPGASENFYSIWYYQNTGTTAIPVFTHQQKNFLQSEMIETGEGAYPVFFDYNQDGKTDLLIGNYGYFKTGGSGYDGEIALYQNLGTNSNPKFSLITRDFAGINSLALNGIAPTFGDMDGDGDFDMITGNSNGSLHYFQNSAGSGNPVNLSLTQANYRGIDVGNFASPQIIDVDRDGKNDFLIGEEGGNINYYKNMGTPAVPSFSLVTANFGGVKVNRAGYSTGYSTPFLFDASGSYKLFVGSERGIMYHYDNIDGNLSGNFHLVDSSYLNIGYGSRTAPYGTDINNDGYMDLVIGNYSGGVELYYGQSAPTAIKEKIKSSGSISITIFPNPSSDFITVEITGSNNRSKKMIQVLNVLGQQISTHFVQDKFILDVKEFSSGIYFINIVDNDEFAGSAKMIIQR